MEDDTKAALSDPKIPETLPINELRDSDYTSALSEFPRASREMSKRFNGLENSSPWERGFHSSSEFWKRVTPPTIVRAVNLMQTTCSNLFNVNFGSCYSKIDFGDSKPFRINRRLVFVWFEWWKFWKGDDFGVSGWLGNRTWKWNQVF